MPHLTAEDTVMVLARSSEAEQAPLESRVRGNKRVVIMPAYVCVCVCVHEYVGLVRSVGQVQSSPFANGSSPDHRRI